MFCTIIAFNCLKILQWNGQSVNNKKPALLNHLSEFTADVLILSETWFKPTWDVSFKGYNIVRKDHFRGKTGCAIFVSKRLNYTEINLTQNFNDGTMVCGVTLHGDINLNILSIYRPQHSLHTVNDWLNIFSQCPSPCLIGGDFNVHNSLFGSSRNDSAGNTLLNAIDLTPLVVLNNGKPTRLVKPPSAFKSAVDITLASPDVAPDIIWDVADDSLGSDHLVVHMQYSRFRVDENSFLHPRSNWDTKNANWELFRNMIDSDFHSPPVFQTAQSMYQYFTDSIDRAANSAFRRRKPVHLRRKYNPVWWNELCSGAIKNRRDALNKYRDDPTLDNFLIFQRVSAETKRMLRSTAKDSWRTFCEGLNSRSSSSTMWSQIRKMRGKGISVSKECSADCAESILRNLTPDYVAEDVTNFSVGSSTHPLQENFCVQELDYVLKRQANTAPGQDSYTYEMLYNLPESAKRFLIGVFSRVLIFGESVEALKVASVILIQKQGKPVHVPTSYRPISLLSCVLKLLEKIIKNRLEWWLSYKNIKFDFQFGFKKNSSTLHAAGQLITDIQLCFSRNNYLGAIFLDVEGAYNSVNLSMLEDILNKLEIPSNISRNICNLYRNRKIIIKQQNNTIGPRFTSLGLPQGSVLSPFLFNIYMSDFSIKPVCNIIQYADDIVLYLEEKNIQKCIEGLQAIIPAAVSWLSNRGLVLSQEKTFFSIFTRHNIPNQTRNLILPSDVTFKNEIKCLGFFLDQKLTWRKHIDNIINKGEKIINVLRMVTRISWGADVITALTIYRALIRSLIDYGCVLYGGASRTLLKRVDTLQNKAIRICIGAMNSTPVEALRAEAGEPPLFLRRVFLAKKFTLKSMSVVDSSLISKVCLLTCQDLTNKFWIKKPSPPLSAAFSEVAGYNSIIIKKNPSDSIYIRYISLYIRVIFPLFEDNPLVNKKILTKELAQFITFKKIFTDGSKSSLGVGYACLIPDSKHKILRKLPKEASIFTAEAYAILEALESIESQNIKAALILSDSKSVLQSISNFRQSESPIIQSIVAIFNKLYNQGCDIVFMWIKAHCGLYYNEQVDKLAKMAVSAEDTFVRKIPYTDLVAIIRRQFVDSWQQHYSAVFSNKPTNYFLIHPTLSKNQWHKTTNSFITRKMYVTIARLMFNHGRFPSHLSKINISDSDACICGERGDINHIVFGCPHISDRASMLLHHLHSIGLMFPLNVNSILGSGNLQAYIVLYNYFRWNKIEI